MVLTYIFKFIYIADKIMNNSNNRFMSESVDDDQFLRHPRSGSGYILSNQYNQLGHNTQQQPQEPPRSNSSLEQQRQVY